MGLADTATSRCSDISGLPRSNQMQLSSLPASESDCSIQGYMCAAKNYFGLGTQDVCLPLFLGKKISE